MILVTMESSPLAITENTESTMFEKENPLISLSIVKLTLFGSLYTIRSSTVNLKQNPRFFSFLFFFLLQNLLDRDFILITGNPIIFKFQRERKNYDSRSIDHREIWYERSNVTVEFKITKKKKKKDLLSKFEIQSRIIFLQPCFTILLIEGPIVLTQGRAIVLPRGQKFEIGALWPSRGNDDHR